MDGGGHLGHLNVRGSNSALSNTCSGAGVVVAPSPSPQSKVTSSA